MSRVLVVDDDPGIRTVVARALEREGHEVRLAATLAEADRLLTVAPDVLVTDVALPDGDGLDRLEAVTARWPALPVIVLSARNTLTTAVRAQAAGAYEYLPKPFDLDALTAAVAGAAARGGVAHPPVAREEDAAPPLVGRSPAMQAVYRLIARVVATDLPVLVTGESGTGKELVARALHELGPRRAAPFVALNTAAIPRELIEAELFGHERGAFTGAAQKSAGRFAQAAGGTLFLDEIGDMPAHAQTRLLRVLQEGEFTPVGAARAVRADVRVVAATNRDLTAAVTAGQFREDLFYRLAVVPIALPPLRERREDVALLAGHLLDKAAAAGLPRRHLSADAIAALEVHDWPGNVRELENLLRRLAVMTRDPVIEVEVVRAALGAREEPADEFGPAVRALIERLARERPAALADGSLHEAVVAAVERPLIAAMLQRHGGNQLRTARALGLNRNTLKKRLDALDILAH